MVWRTFTTASNSEPSEMAQGFPPIPVETVALKRGKGIQRVQLLGQVEASETATLRTQTAGTVQQVLVEAGDCVAPGMTIATLDDLKAGNNLKKSGFLRTNSLNLFAIVRFPVAIRYSHIVR